MSPLLSILTDIFYAIFIKLTNLSDKTQEYYNPIALAVEQCIRVCFNSIIDFPYPQQQFQLMVEQSMNTLCEIHD